MRKSVTRPYPASEEHIPSVERRVNKEKLVAPSCQPQSAYTSSAHPSEGDTATTAQSGEHDRPGPVRRRGVQPSMHARDRPRESRHRKDSQFLGEEEGRQRESRRFHSLPRPSRTAVAASRLDIKQHRTHPDNRPYLSPLLAGASPPHVKSRRIEPRLRLQGMSVGGGGPPEALGLQGNAEGGVDHKRWAGPVATRVPSRVANRRRLFLFCIFVALLGLVVSSHSFWRTSQKEHPPPLLLLLDLFFLFLLRETSGLRPQAVVCGCDQMRLVYRATPNRGGIPWCSSCCCGHREPRFGAIRPSRYRYSSPEDAAARISFSWLLVVPQT